MHWGKENPFPEADTGVAVPSTLIQAKKRLTAFMLLYCVCQKARNSKSAYASGCCRSLPISRLTSRVRNMWKPTATMESCHTENMGCQKSQGVLKWCSTMRVQGRAWTGKSGGKETSCPAKVFTSLDANRPA